jgi:hypothetical protein
MKHRVPLARANLAQCLELAPALAAHGLTSRQIGTLCAASSARPASARPASPRGCCSRRSRTATAASRQRHLFPVQVLGALFRGKVLAALQRSLARGELASPDPVATRRTLGALHGTPWLVYVKRP